MLTVSDFLRLEPFKDFEVVSGSKGLGNKISSVNIMDNPDALDWFSPEEMLISTGFFFKDDKTMQNKIIRQLKTINCPALIIKPKSYLGKIPENMLAISNELGIPIIEKPYGISFSKVMVRVMEELSVNYDALNKKSLDIHNEFFQLTLHGGGIQKISDTLSDMLQAAVFLYDQNWNLLTSTETYSFIKKLGNHEVKNALFSSKFISSLPLDFENIKKPLVRVLSIKNKQIPCIVMPVFFNDIHYGFIIILQFTQTLLDHHYIALENGSMAFALEQIQSTEVERTRNRIREDFFDELLSGKIISSTSLKNLADLHGIDSSLWYTAFVFKVHFSHFKLDDMIRIIQIEENTIKKIKEYIYSYSLKTNTKLLVFSRKGQIIVLAGTLPEKFLKDTVTFKQKAIDFIETIESNFINCTLNCGIGNVSKQLLNIKTSFYEAQEALRLTQGKTTPKKVYHFDDFAIQHFLQKNISYEEMNSFFSNTLGQLNEHDQKYQSELMETLEAWVLNQLNIAETARQLFIHRNSLLYRIEKIKYILTVDFKDPDELLKIQLAFKMYHMLHYSKKMD